MWPYRVQRASNNKYDRVESRLRLCYITETSMQNQKYIERGACSCAVVWCILHPYINTYIKLTTFLWFFPQNSKRKVNQFTFKTFQMFYVAGAWLPNLLRPPITKCSKTKLKFPFSWLTGRNAINDFLLNRKMISGPSHYYLDAKHRSMCP